MRISVISFTENGYALSLRIRECLLGEDIEAVDIYRDEALNTWVAEQFAAGRPIIFVGACGIAVRAIAPHLKSKLTDSPVLVMDETGQFVIPLVSGHVGGANELARRVASCMGAVPVITTATDLNGCFAVDLFAKANRLQILKKEGIAAVSSKLLAGEQVTVSVQGIDKPKTTGDADTNYPGCGSLPEGLVPVAYPPEEYADIVISCEEEALAKAACPLRPKTCAAGIGCRKGKSEDELEEYFLGRLGDAGISPGEVFAIASIDQKSGEEGLCLLAEKYRIPFVTFSAEELEKAQGDFDGSEFVRERMGVDNVCERAALLACGGCGELILKKQAQNGMTLAAARRPWSPDHLDWTIGREQT